MGLPAENYTGDNFIDNVVEVDFSGGGDGGGPTFRLDHATAALLESLRQDLGDPTSLETIRKVFGLGMHCVRRSQVDGLDLGFMAGDGTFLLTERETGVNDHVVTPSEEAKKRSVADWLWNLFS